MYRLGKRLESASQVHCGRVALTLFGWMVGTTWSALLLADFGHFTSRGAILSGIPFAVALWIWGEKLTLNKRDSPGSFWLGPLVLVLSIGSLFLTIPPSEMILGGWDPGVYLHTGAAVSEGGGIHIPSEDIFQHPREMQLELTQNVSGWEHPFPGMFPLKERYLTPQFMHLYPSLLAVAHSLAGIWGALCVNPLLNSVALVLTFWLSTRILGKKWAVVVVFLLLLNPAQLWQAKFSTAEMLTQVLFTGAFAFLFFGKEDPDVFSTIISGFLFGLAFLARYDAILVIVPLLLWLAALSGDPGNRLRFFGVLAGLALPIAHGVFRMIWVAPFYRPLPGLVFPLLAGCVALICVLFFSGCTRFGARMATVVKQRAAFLRITLVLAFVSFAGWAAYIRPRLRVEGRVSQTVNSLFPWLQSSGWNDVLSGPDAWNIFYLQALFGWFGLLLGLVGVLVLILKSKQSVEHLWMVSCLFPLVVLTTSLFHDHFMMWSSRRFVPVVVPFVCIAVTRAIRELHRFAATVHPRLGAGVSAGLVFVLLATLIPKSRMIVGTREWPGLVQWVEEVAGIIPGDTLVLCDQPGFAAPFRFLHGLHAHEVYRDVTATEVIERHKNHLDNMEQKVFVLSMREQPSKEGIRLREIGSKPLVSHIFEQPRHRIPTQTRGRGGPFVLWEVEFVNGVDRSETLLE